MIKAVCTIVIFIGLLQMSFVATAGRDCFEKRPEFSVDSKLIWDSHFSAVELFDQAQKKKIPKAKKINAEGIWLPNLIQKYAKKGTLLIKSCGKKSFTVEVSDLLSGDDKKSGYYLALTKKKTLKVMFAVEGGPARTELKRVSSLRVTTF